MLTTPIDDGWSPKDVAAHVLDTDAGVIRARIARIVGEERPFIRSIDPTARLQEGGYAARDIESLLVELEAHRRESLAWLRTLSPALLARTGEHDEAGEVSAADLVHQWAYHDLMHLQQAAAMLQAPLLPRMGNSKRFYFDV